MHGGTERGRGFHCVADFDRLDGLQRHYGRGQVGIQTLVPVGIGAQTGRHVVRYNLENAAYRIPSAQRQVNLVLHAHLGGGIDAAQKNFVLGGNGLNGVPAYRYVKTGAADGDYVAQYFDAQLAQQQLGQRSGGDAGSRLACGSALQNVAGLAEVVLHRPGEIGVAGPRRGHPLMFGGIAFLNRQ